MPQFSVETAQSKAFQFPIKRAEQGTGLLAGDTTAVRAGAWRLLLVLRGISRSRDTVN